MKLFHIHTWSKWSDPVATYNSGHKQQWRVCTTCNKASFRTLDWDKQTSEADVTKAILTAKAKEQQ